MKYMIVKATVNTMEIKHDLLQDGKIRRKPVARSIRDHLGGWGRVYIYSAW